MEEKRTTANGSGGNAAQTDSTSARQQWGLGLGNQNANWDHADGSPLSPLLARTPNFRVLIVDDNRPVRILLRSILLAFGVKHVDEASDGVDAIRKLQRLMPDLVITDLEMTPMNGLEFTRQVRTNPKSPNKKLPIVIMTGHTEQHRILEIREAGLTEILAKPIAPNFVSRVILTAMKNLARHKKKKAAHDGSIFNV